MRLQAWRTFLAAIALLSLVACGPERNEAVTLNIVGEALPPLQSLGEIAKDYEKQTGVKVVIHPYEFETALQRAQLDFTSGKAQYDLVMGIFYNIGRYYEAGYVTPFDDKRFKNRNSLPIDAFYPALQDIVMRYENRNVAYPFSAQTMFLWFRRDLFEDPSERQAFRERYGYDLPVPNESTLLNWMQYKDIAQFFTRKRGDKLAGRRIDAPLYGVALQMKRHPSSFYEFTNFLFSFGGGLFDVKTGAPIINSKENVAALTYYLSLRDFAPPNYLQSTWDDALAQMQQGQVAMTIMWSDAPSALYDSSASKVVDKIGYSLVPVDTKVRRKVSVFGGWGFLINAKGKHQDEAYDFVQWVSKPEQQIRWAKSGGLPASSAIFADPDYRKIPYVPAQNQALQHLVSWPRDPGAEQFINDGIELLSAATAGQISAQDALDQLQQRVVSRRKN